MPLSTGCLCRGDNAQRPQRRYLEDRPSVMVFVSHLFMNNWHVPECPWLKALRRCRVAHTNRQGQVTLIQANTQASCSFSPTLRHHLQPAKALMWHNVMSMSKVLVAPQTAGQICLHCNTPASGRRANSGTQFPAQAVHWAGEPHIPYACFGNCRCDLAWLGP